MHTVLIDEVEYNLTDLEKDCWIKLLNGTQHYKHPLHNPAVANVSNFGVNMRTVVLRNVQPEKKQLAFHTDIRSGKWTELEQQNTISWLFYDAAGRIQIRLGGHATLHHDDAVADQAWAVSTMSSRKIYLGEHGPSTSSEAPVSGLPAALETRDPTAEESMAGRKNFGTVITTVQWMEWLFLNSKGHRRAKFKYTEDAKFTAEWLVP